MNSVENAPRTQGSDSGRCWLLHLPQPSGWHRVQRGCSLQRNLFARNTTSVEAQSQYYNQHTVYLFHLVDGLKV